MTSPAGQPASTAVPALLREHGGTIYALALRLCGSRADAEDLVQDVFLSAYRSWDRFEGRSDPRTWLYTIAARACRRKRRPRAGQPRRVASIEELAPMGGGALADPAAAESGPAAAAMRREALAAMEAEIPRLPEAFRLPLVLKDVLELPVADVAAALGIKPETVKTRVHRARLMLRRALDRRLPRRDLPPAIYERSVCFDLLRAKQEALDAGREFPVGSDVVCGRCRAVFAGMDLARDACADLARGDLPPKVREAVLSSLGPADAAPADGPASRRRRARPRRAQTGNRS